VRTKVLLLICLGSLAWAAAPAAAQAGNRAPDCRGTTTAVAPGGERTFRLECSDPDGPQPSKLTIVGAPQHGTLTDLGQLRVVFRPAAGYSGNDSFTFRVSDGEDTTAVLTQQLRVTNDNLPPECPAATVTVVVNKQIDAPCFDPNEGDPALPIVVTPPQHGTAEPSVHSTAVSYSANGYSGPDSMTIKATDGVLESAPGTIDLDVVPLEPPVCESQPVIPVRTDATKDLRVRCRDNTGMAYSMGYTLQVTEEPQHGEVIVGMMGGASYAPDPGYTGPDTIKLKPKNSAGSGPTLTVQVAVAPDANEAPQCTTSFPLRLRTGATATLPLGCFDPDGDNVERIFDPLPKHGVIGQSHSGPFSNSNYTADDGYDGPDSVGVVAQDARGARSAKVTQSIQVVDDDNNTPPDCRPVNGRVRSDQKTNVWAGCFDAEGDPMTVTWDDPAHGTATKGEGMGPPGTNTYLVYDPDDGFTGLDRVVMRVEDDHGGEAVVTALVQVVAPAPPSCSAPSKRNVRTGAYVELSISCYDFSSPVDATLHVDAQHGTVTDYSHGSFRYTPDAGYSGADSFTVRATNAVGSTDVVQQLEVGPDVNSVPQCSAHWNASTRSAPVTLQLSCYDTENDPITIETVTGPEHGSLGPYDQQSDQVTYTPNQGYQGVDSFTFRASDGRGHSATVEQTIKVLSQDENKIPRCQSYGTHTEKGESAPLWAYCSDGDGDPLTIAIADEPEHGTVEKNAYGGFVYTPDEGFEGTDELGITASDGRATSAVADIWVQVGTQAWEAPSCTSLTAHVDRGVARRVQLRCHSVFDQPVTTEIVAAPVHGELGPIDGSGWATYTPDAGFEGTDTFTFRGRVGDTVGPAATATMLVEAPRPPDDDPPPPPGDEPPAQPRTDPQPPPPPPPPPPDTGERAAEQRLGGDAVQAGLDLGTARAFVPADARGGTMKVDDPSEKLLAVVCSTSCEVSAGQTITLGGAGARAAAPKPIRLRTQRLRLRPGQPGVVVLKLTAAQRKKVRRARRATLRITVAVKDASGKTARDTARYRLRLR
jgi:hypothetical protein